MNSPSYEIADENLHFFVCLQKLLTFYEKLENLRSLEEDFIFLYKSLLIQNYLIYDVSKLDNEVI